MEHFDRRESSFEQVDKAQAQRYIMDHYTVFKG